MNKVMKLVLLVISFSIFIFFAFKISIYVKEEKQNQNIAKELTEIAVINIENKQQSDDTENQNKIPIEVNFEELKKKNQNIVAWIYQERN